MYNIIYVQEQRPPLPSEETTTAVAVFMLIDSREVFCLKLISLNRISRSMSPCTRRPPRIIYVSHCKSFRTFVLYTTAFFFCGSHAGCSRDQYNKFFTPFPRRHRLNPYYILYYIRIQEMIYPNISRFDGDDQTSERTVFRAVQ